MATSLFAPLLHKVEPCLSNSLFFIRALLFWPSLEFEVLLGNIRIDQVTFTVCIEIGFSLFDTYAVVNAYIAWKNFKLKRRPEKERAYKNKEFDKHGSTLCRSGANGVVAIISQQKLTKTNDSNG